MKLYYILFIILALCLILAAVPGCAVVYSLDGGGDMVMEGSGLADFGLVDGLDYSSLRSETMVLMATWTNNLRYSGSRFANSEGSISLCRYGDVLSYANSKEYRFNVFNVDALCGFPVQVWFDGGGNIVSLNIAGSYSRAYRAAEITLKGNGNYTLADGTVLSLDLSALDFNSDKYAFGRSAGIFFINNSLAGTLGVEKYCDEKTTFVDVNGDGKYDYMYSTTVLNAVEVVAVNDTYIQLGYSFGSVVSTGWLNGNNYFNYTLADGVEKPKAGDYVNIEIIIDCTSSTAVASDFPCRILVTSKSAVLTGKITAVSGSGYNDLSVTIDTQKYVWSNTVSTADYSDGVSGCYGGRLYMNSANIGKSITLVLDEAGCVVRAIKNEEKEISVGEYSFESDNGTMLAPVIESLGIISKTITYSSIISELDFLRDMGFTKVYMIVPNIGNSTYGFGKSGVIWADSYNNTVKQIGDPIKAYVDAAHSLGMQIYAVFKPYEGGGVTTVPSGAELSYDRIGREEFGGLRFGWDDLLIEHPEYRVIRKDDGACDEDDRPVTSVEMLFMAGSYQTRTSRESRDVYTTVGALSGQSILTAMKNDVQLWISKDNGKYTLYDGDYNVEFTQGKRQLYDSNGFELSDGESNVIILTISGFSLPAEYQYMAVTFSDASNLRTIPYSMISIYSGAEKLWSTVTQFVRNPYGGGTDDPSDYQWGREEEPLYGDYVHSITVTDGVPSGSSFDNSNGKKVDEFYKWGFEFNWFANGFFGDEWRTSAVYGIARGKAEYLSGCACEGYEEVRQFWLDSVKEYMDCGFDGLNIRIQSHCSMMADYVNYGFNEPIVERYLVMYGEDITKIGITKEVALNIMRVRGSYFEEFLEEAAQLVHSYGKVFGINLREAYTEPILDTSINEVSWWTMPKIILDWQKCVQLADVIIIKDYIYKTENVDTQAVEIREYAKSLGKEVWIMCYDQQAGVLTRDFMLEADKNDSVDGVMLYQYEGTLGWKNKVYAAISAINPSLHIIPVETEPEKAVSDTTAPGAALSDSDTEAPDPGGINLAVYGTALIALVAAIILLVFFITKHRT